MFEKQFDRRCCAKVGRGCHLWKYTPSIPHIISSTSNLTYSEFCKVKSATSNYDLFLASKSNGLVVISFGLYWKVDHFMFQQCNVDNMQQTSKQLPPTKNTPPSEPLKGDNPTPDTHWLLREEKGATGFKTCNKTRSCRFPIHSLTPPILTRMLGEKKTVSQTCKKPPLRIPPCSTPQFDTHWLLLGERSRGAGSSVEGDTSLGSSSSSP